MSYEKQDFPFIAIVAFVGGTAVVLIFALLITMPLLNRAETIEEDSHAPDHPLAEEKTIPPEPRLQVAPASELAAHRTIVEAELDTYGKTEGKIRIPIERAMELVVKEGLE